MRKKKKKQSHTLVKTDKPCYCLGFGNTVNYIIIWWPFIVWPKLGSASFGVRQCKVTKLWYNLQYTQNLDNNHGLSITYTLKTFTSVSRSILYPIQLSIASNCIYESTCFIYTIYWINTVYTNIINIIIAESVEQTIITVMSIQKHQNKKQQHQKKYHYRSNPWINMSTIHVSSRIPHVWLYPNYSITSMARTRMARLPWMIRTLFSVPIKFFK